MSDKERRLEAVAKALQSFGGSDERPDQFPKPMFALWCCVPRPERHPVLARREAEVVEDWWPGLDAVVGRALAWSELPTRDQAVRAHFAAMGAPLVEMQAERFAKLAVLAEKDGPAWRPEEESLECLFAVALADSSAGPGAQPKE
jgi:hypothetical protein